MLKFSEYLEEAKKEGGFKTGDSAGKLYELLKAREQNGGTFPESYRAEGKKPEDIHNIAAQKMFGKDFEKNPEYKNLVQTAKIAETHNTEFNKLMHGHDPEQGYKKVAWTSQPSDHYSETGVEDKNSVADSIPTLHHGQKVGQSDKLTQIKSPVNYKNPGVATFAQMSGANMSDIGADHSALLKKHGISTSDKGYEAWANWKGKRDYIPTGEERKKAEEIEASSKLVNQDVAQKMHNGFLKKTTEDREKGGSRMRDAIMNAVAPPTHLKTVVTHTEVNDDGSHHRTKVYDLHDHINQYLNHFTDLHVDPEHREGLSSVTIHGHFRHPTDPNHPMSGKRMPVASISVYSGGRPNTIKPRGAITLPSENHKAMHYENQVSSDPKHHTFSVSPAPATSAPEPAPVRAEAPNWIKRSAPGVNRSGIKFSNEFLGQKFHSDDELQ